MYTNMWRFFNCCLWRMWW